MKDKREANRERAVNELRRYHDEMVILWGDDYTSSQQYGRIVEEVANGRYAWMAMDDYRVYPRQQERRRL